MQNGEEQGEMMGASLGLAVFEETFSSQSEKSVDLLQLWQMRAVLQLRKMRGCNSISTSGTACCLFTIYTTSFLALVTITQNQDTTQSQNNKI